MRASARVWGIESLKRVDGVWLLAMATVCFPGNVSLAEEPQDVGSAVQTAVASVYPSLIRIHVVGVYYEGGREIKTESFGSGVIISPEGHVITNHHVAGHARRLRCTLADRQELGARLIGTDPLTDIAIIQLDLDGRVADTPLPVAGFGDSDQLRVGDRVLAMGSPLALSQSVTLGIVSNLEMTMPQLFWPSTFQLDGEETGSLVRWIGHDAQIFPGNSGGPLVNAAGEIIGINEISFGLAGAIPGNLAAEIAAQLIESGRIERSWLGVQLQPLLADSEGGGVLVASVVPGSPAEIAGLVAGDVLTAYEGVPLHVRYGEELPIVNQLMLESPVGAEVELEFMRKGAVKHAVAKLVSRGAAQGEEVELEPLGVTVRELTLLAAKQLAREPGSGVLVSSVRPGSAAAESKPPLSPGDIIVTFGDEPALRVATLRASVDAAVPREAVIVAFERGSESIVTVVRLGRRNARDRSAEAVKAWVPVATQVLTSGLAEALSIPADGGVRVTEVYAGDTADAAGIQVGDVFVSLDGQGIPATQLEDAEVFASIVRQYRVDSEVLLEGYRDGKPLELNVRLAKSPPSERELVEYRDTRFDFSARDLTFLDRRDPRLAADQLGALITGVESGGWAALARLAVGDVVIAIDDQSIGSGDDLETYMEGITAQEPARVVFHVRRGVSTLFLELEPDWGSN
jgi:serine protease Do